ncbi:hypothetical protein CK203_110810 [Vitis vinifera]|uniref:Uncharacterized protein n=1 Tax=Vitis vinifera TaxID=29760 RepID=A0A438C8X9_VITVI|nr:hypothetical protein CK203_110810 [Vitis vinifera]
MQHMELDSIMPHIAVILIQSMAVSCVEEMLQQMFAWIVWKQQLGKSDYVVLNRKWVITWHMFGTKEGNINTDQTLYCHLNVLWTCPTEVAVAALWILWLTFILAVVQRRGEGFFKLAENVIYELYPFYTMPAVTTTPSPGY